MSIDTVFFHVISSSHITRYGGSMGYKTKVQCIKRKKSEQWYINFPSAIAQAMEFSQSEAVEWIISDKQHLILHRPEAPGDPITVKKNGKHFWEKS
jgi:hypothetical protein